MNEYWIIERKEDNKDWEFYDIGSLEKIDKHLSLIKSNIATFRKRKFVPAEKANETD